MRISVRRYRRRRTGSDSLGFAQSHFSAPFFDRLVYLSHSINQIRKPDAPFIILVSRDNYLRTGIQHGPSPLRNCCHYDSPESAMKALHQWPNARLVVDIETRTMPLLALLDTLRPLALFPPRRQVNLLVRADDYDGRLMCKSAGPFTIFERQLPAESLHSGLLAASACRRDGFTRDEWAMLNALAAGESLKQIALQRQQPYHRAVYRLKRILTKLGLNDRHELLHLLNRLSDNTPKTSC